ncbi:MAG: hypothetical protein ACIAQU_06350 [Phycisphaerales bacterium JB064]
MNIPDVAKYQKLLIWLILAQIILILAAVGIGVSSGMAGQQPGATPGAAQTGGVLIIQLVSFAVSIASIVVIVLLTGALGWSVVGRVVAALLMFCPIISLITLLVINSKATNALKAAGYKVGLMGARGGPA